MIIGIDLDNTIIDYRNAFWITAVSTGVFSENDAHSFSIKYGRIPDKNQIKHRIKFEENNDFIWESLQGQVYGRFIHNASIYPGVANFLLHCKRRGVKVYIISHKTEFGHHDKSQTPLRKKALNFLKKNDFLSGDYGIYEKDVFFCDSRREKVNKVADLNCGYFIDDLIDVFNEDGFPENTTKVMFDIQSEHSMNNTLNSWQGINEFIFNQTETSDIGAYVEKGLNKQVKSVQIIKGWGNSSIYKIELKSGRQYAGKLYPDPTFDDRKRLVKETKAYKFLHSNGITSIPGNIWSDINLNFGLFEWVNGIEINEANDENIINATAFVESLVKLSKHTKYEEFQMASAACLSGQMIEQQIRDRYTKIRKFSNPNSDLYNFLDNDFPQIFESILSKSKKLWPGKFGAQLSNDCQLLSPSDFGFHNALLTKDGLKFIDFEYFGWDDPVKLTCDFLLHPGMILKIQQKNLWLNKMESIFINDNTFHTRLLASYGLYGLCWCLIVLNVFITDSQGKKIIAAIEKNDLEHKQNKHLEKSKKLLEHVNKVNKDGLPYE